MTKSRDLVIVEFIMRATSEQNKLVTTETSTTVPELAEDPAFRLGLVFGWTVSRSHNFSASSPNLVLWFPSLLVPALHLPSSRIQGRGLLNVYRRESTRP